MLLTVKQSAKPANSRGLSLQLLLFQATNTWFNIRLVGHIFND
jgi:hypothetical protein